GSDHGDQGVHHTHTIPQTLDTPHETVSGTAADTMNPNAKSTGPTKPAGAPCTGNAQDINKEGERDERATWTTMVGMRSATCMPYPTRPHHLPTQTNTHHP
ncbi:hypothetical protein PAXRUDRAFT_101907, partial [Paxillus rubicundulus Ve08.2h10]